MNFFFVFLFNVEFLFYLAWCGIAVCCFYFLFFYFSSFTLWSIVFSAILLGFIYFILAYRQTSFCAFFYSIVLRTFWLWIILFEFHTIILFISSLVFLYAQFYLHFIFFFDFWFVKYCILSFGLYILFIFLLFCFRIFTRCFEWTTI